MRKATGKIYDENAVYYDCTLCGSKAQYGPHIYEAKWISAYKMILCRPCYEGNWDGFAPHYEPLFECHLAKESIPLPKRNPKGWYPRDGGF